MNDTALAAIRIGTAVTIKAVKTISANRAAKRAEQQIVDDSLMGRAIETTQEPMRVASERLA